MRLDYATREPAPRRHLDGGLVAILLLGLIVRLGWALHLPTDPKSLAALPDQQEYLELAGNLPLGEFSFIDPRFADTVYAYRMPGYPAFVALLQSDLRIVRVVQAILDASNILAVYLLARKWIEPGAARFAALLVAVNPFLVYFCGLILSETLFACMLIWGMTLLVIFRKWFAWAGGVLLLVMSIYVRPSAIALPLLLTLIAAFVNRTTRRPYDWRFSPPVGTLTLLLTVLALLPWAWRNHRVLQEWIWTTTNSGITLYDGLNPDATGASDQTFIRGMPQLRTLDEVGRSRYLADAAKQFARENPMTAVKLGIIKIARTWSPIPLSAEYGTNPKLIVVAAGYMIPLFLLTALGLWLGKVSRSAKTFLCAPAVYFTLVHAVSVGSLRYRIPADLPMAVVAGFTMQLWLIKRQMSAQEQTPIEALDSASHTLNHEP